MTIIDGKKIAADIRAEIKCQVAQMKCKPGLAVVLVGEDSASQIYVRNKQRACEEVGFFSQVYTLPTQTDQAKLNELIDTLNDAPAIHGILVQLPLPKHLSAEQVIARIKPEKDVDAFHPINVGNIMLGRAGFMPCTPFGVMELLQRSGVQIEGKHAVVLGRSNIVGKPMALLLLAANATVTIAHSKTKDLKKICKEADILVSAIGKANFVTGDMIKPGAVVIDVGINRDTNGKLCGDCDFSSVSSVASMITPVPGGVGPMTIAMLLKNTLKAANDAVSENTAEISVVARNEEFKI